MDIKRALKLAISTGKVSIGAKAAKTVVKAKKARLVIISSNCPAEYVDFVKKADAKLPVYSFEGTGIELGANCGKPFAISMLAVSEAGESDILSLVREN